jgi:prolycopene isomerase
MGGLSAAALLAKAGKRVLVVERHDRAGGYAHAFRRKKYLFDAAIHLIGGCERVGFAEGGLVDGLLRLLGMRDRCTFLRVNPFYTAVFPGFRLDVPLGTEGFVRAHARYFPREGDRIRQLVQVCSQLNREVRQFPSPSSLWDFLRMPKRFPALVKYHRATLGEVMDGYLTDPRLKAVFATLWPYLGLPPSRLSFLYWSVMLMSFIEEGAYYCQGSFQNLVNAFVAALEKNGGELLLRSRVRRIFIRNRRVTGVMLENGQRIQAPVIISNADARQTFEELVGADHLSGRFMANLGRLRPSHSAFVVYLATNLDVRRFDASHEMILYRSWDHDETHQHILEGRPSGIAVTVPTLIDPSLAPPGEHLITVTTLIPYEIGVSWRQKKAPYGELLLDEVEAVCPGLRGHITFAEGASPRTMERYTLNLTGAIYGWEVSPEQVGRNRLGHRTPIGGLFLSGHWTQPGGGIYAVLASGLQTAQIVLGYPNPGDLLRALQGQSR